MTVLAGSFPVLKFDQHRQNGYKDTTTHFSVSAEDFDDITLWGRRMAVRQVSEATKLATSAIF